MDIFCGRKSRRIVFPNGAERPTAVLNKFHFQLEHSLACLARTKAVDDDDFDDVNDGADVVSETKSYK